MIGHLYRYPHPFDSARFIYVGQGVNRDLAHRSGRGSFGRRFKRAFPDVELPQPIREQVEVEDLFELNQLETIWMFRYHTWHGYSGGMNLMFPGSANYENLGKIGGVIGGPIGGLLSGGSPEGRERMAALGRSGIGSKIVGDNNVKNGWAFELGKRSLESGHLRRITTKETCSKGGQAGGRKRFELYGSPQTTDGSRKGGLTQGPITGRKAVENRTGIHSPSFDKAAAGRLGGPIGGSKKSPAKTAACKISAAFGRHIRWHVRRNIVSPTCNLCNS